MWVGENESAKFWLSVLNSIRARGVEDILIACIDGLTASGYLKYVDKLAQFARHKIDILGHFELHFYHCTMQVGSGDFQPRFYQESNFFFHRILYFLEPALLFHLFYYS